MIHMNEWRAMFSSYMWYFMFKFLDNHFNESFMKKVYGSLFRRILESLNVTSNKQMR